MSRLAIALLVVTACHTKAPVAAPQPWANLVGDEVWLVGDPIRVATGWYTRCVRKTVGLKRYHDQEKDNEITNRMMLGLLFPPLLLTVLTWKNSEVDCAHQPYEVEVQCTRRCTRVTQVAPGDNSIPIIVHEPGPTKIAVTLLHNKTKQTYASSHEVRFVDPAQIDLECFDAAADRFVDCAKQGLDPAQPYVRVTLDDASLPETRILPGGALDVWISNRAKDERLSLEEILGVRPLPAGEYDIELRLHVGGYTRYTAVQRRVRVMR